MQKLTINGNQAKWGDRDLIILGYELVDIEMIHIIFNECVIGFKGGETEINGVIKNTPQEIIDSL
jgi:hypothetical protein